MLNRRITRLVGAVAVTAAVSLTGAAAQQTATAAPTVSVVHTQQDNTRPCATICLADGTSYVPGTPNPDPDGGYQLDGVTASWYTGWQFQYRSVCLETSWSAGFSVIDRVAADWKALNNGLLNTYVRKTAGGCGASGFPPSQRTVFVPATLADNVCGTAPTSYSAATGFVVTSQVKINTSAATANPCRTGDRWVSLWMHEFGHSQGFAHTPDSEADSVMHVHDDGIPTPSKVYEKPRQASIYGNNTLWWPAAKTADGGPPCVVCW